MRSGIWVVKNSRISARKARSSGVKLRSMCVLLSLYAVARFILILGRPPAARRLQRTLRHGAGRAPAHGWASINGSL